MAAYVTPDPLAEISVFADESDDIDSSMDSWTLDELDYGAEFGAPHMLASFSEGHGD